MSNDFDRAEAFRQALVDLYWEAMNKGTTNKSFDTDEDGFVNDSGPSYARGDALHQFARFTIKPALEAVGINPFER